MRTAADVIREARARAGLTQRELADLGGTSQPAIARVESGRGSVTVATLARLLETAGFDLVLDLAPRTSADALVEAYKRDVDRTLLRQNLRRTVEERMRHLTALQELARELRAAVERVGQKE